MAVDVGRAGRAGGRVVVDAGPLDVRPVARCRRVVDGQRQPLEPAQQAALQQRLSAATAREVTVTTKVDPALIGGIVARIGSTVYDGSLATQLTKLKGRLAENR